MNLRSSWRSASMLAEQARKTSAAAALSSSDSNKCSTVINSCRALRASTKAMCRLTSSSSEITLPPLHIGADKQFDKTYSMTKSTLRININKRVILVLPDRIKALTTLLYPYFFHAAPTLVNSHCRPLDIRRPAPVPSGIAADVAWPAPSAAPSRHEWQRYRADRPHRQLDPRGALSA